MSTLKGAAKQKQRRPWRLLPVTASIRKKRINSFHKAKERDGLY
jgi:hypothetical protein